MALDQATKVLLAELLGDLTAVREELDQLPASVRTASRRVGRCGRPLGHGDQPGDAAVKY